MLTNWFYAVAIGFVIICALAAYAISLLIKVKKQNQQLNHQANFKDQSLQVAYSQHDHKVLSSVLLIVRAMEEEQCDFSEGSWRLAVLLSSLKTSQHLEEQFPAIFTLYNNIKHLDILDSRKSLERKQRMQQDLQRMKAESESHSAIIQDLPLLKQYTVERLNVLATNIL